MHEVYRSRIFYKQRRGPLRIFPVLTGKVVPTEKRDITLVGVNIFDTGKLLKHKNDHLLKFSVLTDYNFHLNIGIPSRQIQKKFPKSEIFSNTEVFLYDLLHQSETKIPTESCDIPLLCRQFSDTEFF